MKNVQIPKVLFAFQWIDSRGRVDGYNSVLANSRAEAIELANKTAPMLRVYEPSLVSGSKARAFVDKMDKAYSGMFD